ncbi:hypothetical protein FH972_022904 [Carpinus fangiana]|uniref:ABC-type xenobiotic transporter n=1 Tax=Carpinus fangiana TaxID=176857 RepID=A0A5N6KTM4_9ROSI|nr:hypothetical protein FH972_022904 [Carpinus fangiana]
METFRNSTSPSFAISDEREFDFSLRFEESVLGILPGACLVTLGVLRILQLSSRKSLVLDSVRKIQSRFGLVLLAALDLALIILQAISPAGSAGLSTAASVLTFVESLVLVCLSSFEYAKSARPSPVVTISLGLTILLDSARVRTYWLYNGDRAHAAVFTAAYGLRIALFLLEMRSKRPFLNNLTRHRSLEETAGVIGLFFWTWLNGFLYRGFRIGLGSLNDLQSIDSNLLTDSLKARAAKRPWNTTRPRHRRLLLKIMRDLGVSFWLPVLPRICQTVFTYLQPVLLTRAIAFISSADPSPNTGYGLLGAYFFVYTGLAISSALYWGAVNRFTTKTRGLLILAIYDKTMHLRSEDASAMGAVTLMGTDTQRIADGTKYVHEIWAVTIESGIGLYLLERQVAQLAIIPVAISLMCAFGSSYMAKIAGPRQAVWLKATQERLRQTIPVLTSMKEVKFLGLGKQVASWIQTLRIEEVDISRWYRRILIFAIAFSNLTSVLAPIAVFGGFTAIASAHGTTLDASRMFASLSLINLLALPLSSFLQSLPMITSAFACFSRIQEFIELQERHDFRLTSESPEPTSNSSSILESNQESYELQTFATQSNDKVLTKLSPQSPVVLQHASLAWSLNATPFLRDFSVSILPQTFTMVAGPSSCGKTGLLKSILGETFLSSGSVRVATRDIAYAAQDVWIRNSSIKDNIIGGSAGPVDHEFLKEVVKACALDEDFGEEVLEDDWLVGSRGGRLSGGQRQRLAIARAVYARKRITLFDDVLSGLDAVTEEKVLLRVCGPDGLLKQNGSTIILASHSLRALRKADQVIILNKKGSITHQGRYEEANLNPVHLLGIANEGELKSAVTIEPTLAKSFHTSATRTSPLSNTSESGQTEKPTSSVYRFYLRSLGRWNTAAFFALCFAFVFCTHFPNLWLSFWANANAKSLNSDTAKYLGVYATVQISGLFVIVLWGYLYFDRAVGASGKFMHLHLLDTVMKAPAVFFASVDSGSIANRFSQDLQLIDRELPNAFLNTTEYVMSIIAQMILIAFVSAYVSALYPFIAVALFLIQRFYLATSRPLRILDIEAKAPLHTHFVESLEGVLTVRAFGWQKRMEEEHDRLLDLSQKPFYLMLSIQRWLNLVLDLLVAGVAVAVIGLVVPLRSTLQSGYVGVALSNIMTLGETLRNLIMFWTMLETSIGAVTRILSFAKNTPVEGRDDLTEEPQPHWPDKGEINIKETSASYYESQQEQPLAIEGATLQVKAGQRVGIVGRSGSGKSTLLGLLFRMLECQSGQILIDGIDIRDMPRATLRGRLNAVPQSPFLMTGCTVRRNLDPWDNTSESANSEAQLWSALAAVGLDDLVSSKIEALDEVVSDTTFSHGQKQLFCLARAMLRPGKLLLLDESMSAVDEETNERMQKVLAEHFVSHTIVAVAHRLDWVRTADLVVVMEKGRMVETEPFVQTTNPNHDGVILIQYDLEHRQQGKVARGKNPDGELFSGDLSTANAGRTWGCKSRGCGTSDNRSMASSVETSSGQAHRSVSLTTRDMIQRHEIQGHEKRARPAGCEERGRVVAPRGAAQAHQRFHHAARLDRASPGVCRQLTCVLVLSSDIFCLATSTLPHLSSPSASM